ncbi:hypothetical protein TNCT_489911 [Trichonephila clavata]|uniref:Uncharacterized protein n=1 Tax=Trichonephila clavata TaxID=2740835 RepID=A0A8X6GW12_TRICU|nr:hypothetical protein TNCT_489911 [Trichonephila clavata]
MKPFGVQRDLFGAKKSANLLTELMRPSAQRQEFRISNNKNGIFEKSYFILYSVLFFTLLRAAVWKGRICIESLNLFKSSHRAFVILRRMPVADVCAEAACASNVGSAVRRHPQRTPYRNEKTLEQGNPVTPFWATPKQCYRLAEDYM